jgi:diguanylate cyclase (GGDEF)-like protein
VICGTAWLAFARGWNLRYRDPNLTEPLIMVAILLQLGVAMAAPQVAFPFIANLFTVFAFGMLWLTLRNAVAVWSLGVFGAAVVFYAVGERMGAPTGSAFEIFLMWLYFSLILGRCLMVSVAANETRARLAESRRQLSDTLEQVQRLASRDELTRALNRRSLEAALDRERSRAERSGAPFCIAMIDLDRFKAVNDSYGHAAGDAVLRGFAAAVHDTMRMTDVFGRYGGEEFLLILVGTAAPEALEAVERIRVAIAAHDWRAIAPDAPVTMSAGVAAFRKGETIEQLLYRADQALYQAKREGRNRAIASNP